VTAGRVIAVTAWRAAQLHLKLRKMWLDFARSCGLFDQDHGTVLAHSTHTLARALIGFSAVEFD